MKQFKIKRQDGSRQDICLEDGQVVQIISDLGDGYKISTENARASTLIRGDKIWIQSIGYATITERVKVDGK
jgi:hypothetical protein